MTLQVGWLERHWTNVSNVELLVSTHVMGGEILALSLNCNLLSKRKEKSSILFSLGCPKTVGHRKTQEKKMDNSWAPRGKKKKKKTLKKKVVSKIGYF